MTLIPLALSAIFLGIYLLTLGFLISGLFRLSRRRTESTPKISVIVAARNEETKLPNCLQALLKQTYPANLTELLIVNDRSRDRSGDIVEEFAEVAANLRPIHISKTARGVAPKKFALALAISEAKGELIFATDADCVPPPEWLAETVSYFDNQTDMVLGLAPFEPKSTVWSKVLALDSLATALVSAGGAGWNVGITCTGRNLAYRKALFESVGGFAGIDQSLSGDDDLLLQKAKRIAGANLTYALKPEIAVTSAPAASFAEFVKQRRRHVSASKYYSKPLQACYLIFNLANLYLFSFLLLTLWKSTLIFWATAAFAVKMTLDLLGLLILTGRVQRRRLLVVFPLWEIFFLVNQIFISPLGLFGQISWKEVRTNCKRKTSVRESPLDMQATR